MSTCSLSEYIIRAVKVTSQLQKSVQKLQVSAIQQCDGSDVRESMNLKGESDGCLVGIRPEMINLCFK